MSWRGPSFPIRIGEHGIFQEAADVELIQGNILQILGTRRGERVMLPEFGSRIMDYIFQKLTHTTCVLIRHELIRAIARWEPRVILNKQDTTVTAYPSEFMVVADLRYWLRPKSEVQSFAIEVSRTGGVRKWLG